MAKAELAALLDDLASQAIISDPAAAKAALTATIDSMNPKRLNVVMPLQLSGNANIIDVTLEFGFFFSAAA
jgi:hypothetical protein